MSCIPSSSKCEWSEIRHFVDHYNVVSGSAYKRKACLDVETRNCAQPELLCRDEITRKEIVIERKLLTWPANYVEQHKNEHDFFKTISASLGAQLGAHPFTLEMCPPRNMRRRKEREVLSSKLANVITGCLTSIRPGDTFSSTIPFPWSLQMEYLGEREDDEPTCGLKIVTHEAMPEELKDSSRLPPQLLENLSKHYSSCDKKFNNFGQATKILMLQLLPVSLVSGLDDIWWQQVFSLRPPSSIIDEVWIAVDYGNEVWCCNKVYERSSQALGNEDD